MFPTALFLLSASFTEGSDLFYERLFLNLSPPQLYHSLGMFLFCRIVLRLPYPFVFQFVRKKLLFDKVTFIAVCIFIFLSVAQLLHQFGRSIAQM